MPIATTTALLIGAGISAGAGLGAAKMASGAAKDAAATQGESADKALAFAQQQFEQQRADTAPWRQTGGAAVQTLGGLMGLGGGGGGAQASTPSLTAGGPAMYTPQTMPPRGSSAGTRLDLEGNFVPVNPYAAHANGGNWSGDSTASTYGSVAHGGFGGEVQLKAPDGSVKTVPWDEVQHWMALGAVRV